MLKISLAALALTFCAPNFASAAFQDSYLFNARTKAAASQSWVSQLRARLFASFATSGEVQVTVKNTDGSPLAGATVLVGTAAGQPFAGNTATTDASGSAHFQNAALGSALPPVTVSMNGYSTFTMAAPASGDISVTLPKIPADSDFAFLTGTVTGFPSGFPSTTLELGVLIPAFRPEALMSFDPSQFVSSYTTPINVFGERQVPGNVLLPTQHKRYGIIPISLSKPDYTIPLSLGLTAHMAAISGALPISAGYSAISDNDFVGALNLASFTAATWTDQPITINGPQKVDLALSHPIAPNGLSAQLNGVPAGFDAIGVSLVDPSGNGDDFVPLDVKAVKADDVEDGRASLSLGLLQDRPGTQGYYVFTGLFDESQLMDTETSTRSLVGALLPLAATESRSAFNGYLAPIKAEGVSSDDRTYTFSSPANAAAGLTPDLILVNLVSESHNEQTKGQMRRTLWSVVLPGTATSVTLPDLGRPVLPAPDSSKDEAFRWEVIALKASSSAAGSDIQSVLRNLRHVSSLSQKF